MRVRWTNAASISIVVVVIPGGLEIQGLGKGPPGVLTCGAAKQGVFSGLDLLLAPRAEPRVWAMPIWMAQEVGGG